MELTENIGSLKDFSSTKVIWDELILPSLESLELKTATWWLSKRKKDLSLCLNIKKSKARSSYDVFYLTEEYDILETLGMGTYAHVRKAKK